MAHKASNARRLLPTWHFGSLSVKAIVAEFMAATLFVFIGTGCATTFSATEGFSMAPEAQGGAPVGDNVAANVNKLTNNVLTNGSWGITVALAFGLAISVLAYATGHLSGGQINPAVTLSLFVGVCKPYATHRVHTHHHNTAGLLGLWQAIGNICAQLAGAILGSALLYATVPNSSESSLAANALQPGVSVGNALCGEIVMTFVLVSVVLEVATNKNEITRSQVWAAMLVVVGTQPYDAQSPLAIGFAVFCAHAVLLPVDGTSINPARSFGPAVVAGAWTNFWVFVVGPLAGGLLAVPVHWFFNVDLGGSKSSSDPLAMDKPGKQERDTQRNADPLAMDRGQQQQQHAVDDVAV